MAMKRSLIAAFAILVCLMFAWATGAGRPYPANAGGVIDPTCTSSLPCIEYDNNGTGPGIRGISVSGNGLAGATKFNSTSLSNSREGLIGNDISTSGTFNAGVRGLSVRGIGVAGQSTSGSGVAGQSTSATGVVGNGTTGVAGSGSTFGVSGSGSIGVIGSGNIGIEGINTSAATSDAVFANGSGGNLFRGNNSHGVDVFSVDDSGKTTIVGDTTLQGLLRVGSNTTDFGILGEGSSIAIEGVAFGSGIAVRASGNGGNLFVGTNSGLISSLIADDSGNLTITGQIFTAGSCSLGCARDAKAPGTRIVTYAPREAVPTIEDVGEAQLINGQAHVLLDPSFANVIDQRANYLVFITPEGDNKGLYVAQKALAGFWVRESQGGHSTLTFSYRIVAKPFGESAQRLARITLTAQPRPAPRLPRTAPKIGPPKHPVLGT
jgi:hypothetical protein